MLAARPVTKITLLLLLTSGVEWMNRCEAHPGHHESVAGSAPLEVASLQDRLINGLEVRRPADKAFIAQVVQAVAEDRLPLAIVLNLYEWARPKKPRPFPFFQRAVLAVAQQRGIDL